MPSRVRAVLVSGAVAVGIVTRTLIAQTPRALVFEVASVKAAAPDTCIAMPPRVEPGGRFSTSNMPLSALVALAYGPHRRTEIVGQPDWFSARFDVVAKAGGDDESDPKMMAKDVPAMVRALLADRFKLQVHTDVRTLPIYALVKKNANVVLGPDLKVSAVDCPPPSGGVAVFPLTAETRGCGIRLLTSSSVSGAGQQMASIASFLTSTVDRLVIDKTGLAGSYDFALRFDRAASSTQSAVPSDPSVPSIFTAVQDQLGLRLDATTGPVEVLVIDHIERPSED
jgi:uncharacterized protein (TIGR03435 family)